MENVLLSELDNYKILEKAGVRDWVLNYYYDLSVYNSSLTRKLTGVNLHHTDEYIYAIEFFYDTNSTGLFIGKSLISPDNKDDRQVKNYTTSIKLEENEYVEYIKGSFSVDYITELIFVLSSGNQQGFSNLLVKTRTDIKYFSFKKENFQIYALNMAYGKYLTFISPVYREKLYTVNNFIVPKNSNLFTNNKILGKLYEDSIKFVTDGNDLINFGKIKKISLYHDCDLVKGIAVQHEESVKCLYKEIKSNYKCEELILENDEVINKFMIRSGDLIDNITLHTSKGRTVSAGGYGGGAYTLDLDLIKRDFKETFRFCGFSGGYLNNMHSIELIFTK